MARLLFHSDHINDRGVCAAIHEYISCLSDQGHEIVWAYKKNNPSDSRAAISHYGFQHNLEGYDVFQTFSLAAEKRFDWAYFAKKGPSDGIQIAKIPNNMHIVFNYYDPHGEKYAYVSEWLAKAAARHTNQFVPMRLRSRVPNPFMKKLEFVPYSVDMPKPTESLRSKWKIPEEARICLRYGGEETFDIPWVQEVVKQKVETDSNFYFVGINTRKFMDHRRALFLPPINNKQDKTNALNSANYFLHARRQGESFGMAIVEAMQVGVPVLSWFRGWDRNHIELLAPESIYRNRSNLLSKLGNDMNPKTLFSNSLKAEEFRPSRVIDKFKIVFGGDILNV
jgi:hypothetical protein